MRKARLAASVLEGSVILWARVISKSTNEEISFAQKVMERIAATVGVTSVALMSYPTLGGPNFPFNHESNPLPKRQAPRTKPSKGLWEAVWKTLATPQVLAFGIRCPFGRMASEDRSQRANAPLNGWRRDACVIQQQTRGRMAGEVIAGKWRRVESFRHGAFGKRLIVDGLRQPARDVQSGVGRADSQPVSQMPGDRFEQYFAALAVNVSHPPDVRAEMPFRDEVGHHRLHQARSAAIGQRARRREFVRQINGRDQIGQPQRGEHYLIEGAGVDYSPCRIDSLHRRQRSPRVAEFAIVIVL